MADQTQTTLQPLNINTFNAAWKPGTYTEPLSVVNPDGTAPVATSSDPTIIAAAVVTNPGTNANWPVSGYPYLLQLTAVKPGDANITVAADGVNGPVWIGSVVALPPEAVVGNPNLGVYTQPAPSSP